MKKSVWACFAAAIIIFLQTGFMFEPRRADAAALINDGVYVFMPILSAASDSVTIDGARMTLNLCSLPVAGGRFEANRFTAEYRLSNGGDRDAELTFTVPFGGIPSYGDGSSLPSDTGVYTGQETPVGEWRYTYWQNARLGYADISAESRKIRPQSDEISADTLVTKYTYIFESESADDSVYLSAKIQHSPGAFIITDMRYSDYYDSRVSSAGDYLYSLDKDGIVLYVSGATEDTDIRWTVAEDYTSPATMEGFSMRLADSESFTFDRFVESCGTFPDDVTYTDRYNAVVDLILSARAPGNVSVIETPDFRRQLMRWCVVDTILPAGESAVIKTVVPAYPYIDATVSGGEYKYRFMLPDGMYYGDMTLSVDALREISVTSGEGDVTLENGLYKPDGNFSYWTVTVLGDNSGAALFVPNYELMGQYILIILCAAAIIALNVFAVIRLVKNKK